MYVYVIAFALTIVFSFFAAKYYKKYSGFKKLSRAFAPVAKGDNTVIAGYKDGYRDLYLLFLFLSFFPLFFITAVRYDVGTDYFYTYVPNFYAIKNGEPSLYAEWGFTLLNKLISLFTDDAQWVFVITGFLYVLLLVRTIVKRSDNVVISLVTVFLSSVYFISLNNVRQSVAVVILFAALPYITDRKLIPYLACVAAATLFHNSAVLMIVPWFLANVKFIRKHFLLFALLLTAAIPLLCIVLVRITEGTKYYYYFVSEFNSNDSTYVYIAFNLIFYVMAVWSLHATIEKDNVAYTLLVMQFLAFWVSALSLFIRIPEMIVRIVLYFQIYQVLLFPYCFNRKKKTWEKVAVAGICFVLYFSYFIYYIVLLGYHEVLPYRWIFGIVR